MTADRLRLVLAVCAVVATLAFAYWAASQRYQLVEIGETGIVVDRMTGSLYSPTARNVIKWGQGRDDS